MSRKSSSPASSGTALHPRNRHQGSYNLPTLSRVFPALKAHIIKTTAGTLSIDFADPGAVKALNSALLLEQYDITNWDIPEGYLCPAVPGRADYIHTLADLLGESHDGKIPTGPALRGLDVGTGANLIYPLLGWTEYEWQFVGSDIDQTALQNAQRILDHNPMAGAHISLRHQSIAGQIFTGVVNQHDQFDFTLCNPPFHASSADAEQGTRLKRRNLGQAVNSTKRSELNFGGRSNELICAGGEASFLAQMVEESRFIAQQVFWFTSLVSRAANLPILQEQLKDLAVQQVRVIPMAQGNKRSRLLAWSFLDKKQRRAWRRSRWSEI